MTAASFHRGQVAIAHVGDTRAYLLSDGRLEQLTTDMTFAVRVAQERGASTDDVDGLPGSNVLTDAIGREGISIQTLARRLEVGNRLLLCTDGLHRQVADETVAQILRESTDTETACQRLVAAATGAGGKDNIAVALVDVILEPRPAPTPGVVRGLGHRWSKIMLFAVAAVLVVAAFLFFLTSGDRFVTRLEGDRLGVVRQTSVIGPLGRSEETVSSVEVDASRLPTSIADLLQRGVTLDSAPDAASLVRDVQRLASPSPTPMRTDRPSPSPTATPTASP